MEEWRSIAEFAGYEVSNLGRVRDARYASNPDECRIMKIGIDAHGSKRVTLMSDVTGKYAGRRLSVLVATAYLENYDGFRNVTFKDGDPMNCCADNLQWAGEPRAKPTGVKARKPDEADPDDIRRRYPKYLLKLCRLMSVEYEWLDHMRFKEVEPGVWEGFTDSMYRMIIDATDLDYVTFTAYRTSDGIISVMREYTNIQYDRGSKQYTYQLSQTCHRHTHRDGRNGHIKPYSRRDHERLYPHSCLPLPAHGRQKTHRGYTWTYADKKGGGRMTYQTKPENPAKELLREYIPMVKRRDALEREISERYDRATSTTVRLKPISVQGGGAAYDRMADDICLVQDAKAQLRAHIDALNRKLDRILGLIDELKDERYKTVLTLRYIRGMRWDNIALEMAYERTQVFEMHRRALAVINRILRKSAD